MRGERYYNIHKELRGISDPSLDVSKDVNIKENGSAVMINTLEKWGKSISDLISGRGVNINRFPPHLSPPPGAWTVNMIAMATIPAGTAEPGVVLWEYVHRDENILRFTHYAIFNDALFTANAYFKPTVDDNRVFPYHGNPSDNFKISLGNSADMSNSALNPINIELKKGQKITWRVVNNGAVDADMGVRMVGYIDSSMRTTSTRFGG